MHDLIKEVVSGYFVVQDNLKLFHFGTPLYSHHKSADQLRESLTDSFDTLLESYQGIYGRVILDQAIVKVSTPDDEAMLEITKSYRLLLLKFRRLADQEAVELCSLVDNMLENINKFNYLLTFT